MSYLYLQSTCPVRNRKPRQKHNPLSSHNKRVYLPLGWPLALIPNPKHNSLPLPTSWSPLSLPDKPADQCGGPFPHGLWEYGQEDSSRGSSSVPGFGPHPSLHSGTSGEVSATGPPYRAGAQVHEAAAHLEYTPSQYPRRGRNRWVEVKGTLISFPIIPPPHPESPIPCEHGLRSAPIDLPPCGKSWPSCRVKGPFSEVRGRSAWSSSSGVRSEFFSKVSTDTSWWGETAIRRK